MRPCHVQPQCRDVAVPRPWPREGSRSSPPPVDQVVANVEDVTLSERRPACSLNVVFAQSEKRGVDLTVTGPRRWRLDRLAHDLVERSPTYSKTQD